MKNQGTSSGDVLLGRQIPAPARYAPDILCPIPRRSAAQPVAASMYGCDRWTAWELSWLNPSGMPQVAVAELVFPATSPYLIESKSLKLYLHSLSGECYENPDAVAAVIAQDLSRAAQADITATLFQVQELPASLQPAWPTDAILLEACDTHCAADDEPDASLLHLVSGQGSVAHQELLATQLFRSHCPVTGQPDWATVFVSYTGAGIDHACLLRYLCAYRQHQAFHESCVEKIFADILHACAPIQLTVEARFLRRGGLDINPLRSSVANVQPLAGRQWRQ